MKKIIIFSLVLGCIIYSCSPTLYKPVTTDTVKQKQLNTGRTIYVDHCSSCHNLHLPKEFNAEGWKKHLDTMQVKAKISDSEKQLILEYLTFKP